MVNFDKIYQEIEEAVKALESGNGTISENIKIYREALKKVEIAKRALREAENEIKEIDKNDSEK